MAESRRRTKVRVIYQPVETESEPIYSTQKCVKRSLSLACCSANSAIFLSCTPRLIYQQLVANWPFPSCSEPHSESEANCKVIITKISFHSYSNKTSFHMKSFALSLAFIMRFTATRKMAYQIASLADRRSPSHANRRSYLEINGKAYSFVTIHFHRD